MEPPSTRYSTINPCPKRLSGGQWQRIGANVSNRRVQGLIAAYGDHAPRLAVVRIRGWQYRYREPVGYFLHAEVEVALRGLIASPLVRHRSSRNAHVLAGVWNGTSHIRCGRSIVPTQPERVASRSLGNVQNPLDRRQEITVVVGRDQAAHL